MCVCQGSLLAAAWAHLMVVSRQYRTRITDWGSGEVSQVANQVLKHACCSLGALAGEFQAVSHVHH